jgi:O-succinylbenzoic acid--CoA ligase
MSKIRRAMHWTDVPALREEAHFGRKLRCFAERPQNVNALLRRDRRALRRPRSARHRRYRLDYGSSTASPTGSRPTPLGVARGDRVVLFLPNDREFVYALLAVLRLGAVAVPVNVREQRPELAFILAQCGARAIVFDAALADRLPPPAGGCRSPCGSAPAAPGATTLDELLETRSPAAPAADPGEGRPP